MATTLPGGMTRVVKTGEESIQKPQSLEDWKHMIQVKFEEGNIQMPEIADRPEPENGQSFSLENPTNASGLWIFLWGVQKCPKPFIFEHK